MISSYTVSQVLKNKDIVEYLSSKGIHPSEQNGDQWTYCCPLHKEDSPSFYVYKARNDRELQNFYCYGCKQGGDIIHLKAELEHITLGNAISLLSSDMHLSLDDGYSYLLEELARKQNAYREWTPEDISFAISMYIHDFYGRVNFAEPYFHRGERVLQILDDCIHRCDMLRAKELYEALPEFIVQQLEQFSAAKEQEITETALAYANIV